MEYVPYEQFKNIEFIAEGGVERAQDPNSQDIMIIMPYYDSGDLGISKSATESGDDNENYGIIPYMAPEIFQRRKYNKASDIYSFGMIMWELMTESLDIGPVPKNNPGAIYKSRPLSAIINSAMTLRSSKSEPINLKKLKRRFEDDLIEDYNDNNYDGRNIKREKLYENEDYLTKVIDLDIDVNFDNNGYITNEIDFDIDTLK
ncbi:unnamed protein product [Rhizophagus irregularis]|nr:unnamed protein product [Rhizophagus irregularis]